MMLKSAQRLSAPQLPLRTTAQTRPLNFLGGETSAQFRNVTMAQLNTLLPTWLWSLGCCCCLVAKSCLTLFATPWTVACQAPPSMGFSRQDYWSGLPFPSPGDLPDPGIKPASLVSPTLKERFSPPEPPGKLRVWITRC